MLSATVNHVAGLFKALAGMNKTSSVLAHRGAPSALKRETRSTPLPWDTCWGGLESGGVQGALTRTDPRSGDYKKLPDVMSKRSWDGVRGQQLESGGGE